MDSNIVPLVEWIKTNVPNLIRSGEILPVLLHGRQDGNINAEVKTNCQVISPRKHRLDERNVRPVSGPV